MSVLPHISPCPNFSYICKPLSCLTYTCPVLTRRLGFPQVCSKQLKLQMSVNIPAAHHKLFSSFQRSWHDTSGDGLSSVVNTRSQIDCQNCILWKHKTKAWRRFSSKATPPDLDLTSKEVSMEECLVPSTSDIKIFLRKRRYDLKVGFVCFEIDCQFCNYLKDPLTKNPPQTEGKSVFVNKISGIFRCVFY